MSTTTPTNFALGRNVGPSPSFRLGRLARTHDKRIPMLHDLLKGAPLPPPPPSLDNTVGMPANLGIMKNDTLGDCTCAAYYHALQVWSFKAQHNIDTEPDVDVVHLYEQACGYNPNQPGEGPGGNEQHVLTYLLNKGAPYGPTGAQRHKLAAFVEVDVKKHPRRQDHHPGLRRLLHRLQRAAISDAPQQTTPCCLGRRPGRQ